MQVSKLGPGKLVETLNWHVSTVPLAFLTSCTRVGSCNAACTEERRFMMSMLGRHSTSSMMPAPLVSLVDEMFQREISAIFDQVLQFSSGRDKFCALIQGYSKFASEVSSWQPRISVQHFNYALHLVVLGTGRA